MIGNVLYCLKNVYDYLFPPSFDCEKRISEVRDRFTLEDRVEFANDLDAQTFKSKLLRLIGTQKEKEAITFVVKTYLLIKENPQLLNSRVSQRHLIDPYSKLPPITLANGRSLQHIANLLEMKDLSNTFQKLVYRVNQEQFDSYTF